MDAPPRARADAAAPPPKAKLQQYLRFSLGTESCAVRIRAVREIIEVARMTPLPLIPSFVCGVMNLRGAVVPVIDLGARIGLPPTSVGRRSRVVIVDVPTAEAGASYRPLMGVLVDAVHDVHDVLPSDEEAVPRLGTRVPPAYIGSMVRMRGMAVPALDLDIVLAEDTLMSLIAEHAAA